MSVMECQFHFITVAEPASGFKQWRYNGSTHSSAPNLLAGRIRPPSDSYTLYAKEMVNLHDSLAGLEY